TRVRAWSVPHEIPHRSLGRIPRAAARGIRPEHFIEPTFVVIEDKHMTVTRAWARISLDWCSGRNRHRSGIALVAVGREVDLHRSLPGTDDHVRNSHRTAGVEARAKVGVHGRVCADEV